MKTSIIVGSSILLILGLGYAAVKESREFAQYVADHECVVTETKTEREIQYINRYDAFTKTMQLQPTTVTTTSRHYECQVDGEHGTSFWS